MSLKDDIEVIDEAINLMPAGGKWYHAFRRIRARLEAAERVAEEMRATLAPPFVSWSVSDIDAWADRISSPDQQHSTHKHIKSGSFYREIARCKVLTARPIAQGDVVVCYQGENGMHWVRPADEFDDPARFEKIRRHGLGHCRKVMHAPGHAYGHASSDDSPYDVDGVAYCGRCHYVLDQQQPKTEEVMPSVPRPNNGGANETSRATSPAVSSPAAGVERLSLERLPPVHSQGWHACGASMEVNANGAYVRYTDYVALLHELTVVREEYDALHHQFGELPSHAELQRLNTERASKIEECEWLAHCLAVEKEECERLRKCLFQMQSAAIDLAQRVKKIQEVANGQ